MDKATSCVRVYPKSKKQNYSVEQQWYLVKYCEPGRFDLADLELKNDFALSCLHFFLTLFCVFDFNGTKGRNGSLFDKIFSLDLCTPKSRSYCYKGLAILKEKGLITVRTKN